MIDYLALYTLLALSAVWILLLASRRVHEQAKRYVIIGVLLFVLHAVTTYLYYWLSQVRVADSVSYYKMGCTWSGGYKFGTSATIWLTSLLSLHGELSYWTTMVVYSSAGFWAILLLFNALTERAPSVMHKSWPLFFLPGLHLWTSAIGKDVVTQVGLVIAIVSMMGKKLNFFAYATGLIVVLQVRPHIALIMAAAFIVALVFDRELHPVKTMALVVVGASLAFLVMRVTFLILGISSLADLKGFIELRQSVNLHGGSSYDIASHDVLTRIWMYLFEPLIVVRPAGVMQMAAAVENLVVLGVLALFGGKVLLRGYRPGRVGIYSLCFVVIFIAAMSQTTANLGIAVRQKVMLYPHVITLIVLAYRDVRMQGGGS